MSVADRVSEAFNYFVGRGWSREQAAGIVGNLSYESGGLNIGAVGDNGRARGLAQWHPDRRGVFERVFGKPFSTSTFREQLAFVDWELRNTERAAGNALRNATTVDGATRIVMNQYERPSVAARASSIAGRIRAAMGAISGTGDGAGGEGEPAAGEGDSWLPDVSITDLDPTGISGFLSGIFSGEYAARLVAVIVGVILIAVAVAAFVFMQEGGQKLAAKLSPV